MPANALVVAVEELERLYAAVSRARTYGAFTGPFGPLEETAWIHVAIHQLEEVQSLSIRAVSGDLSVLSRLELLWAKGPHWPLIEEVPPPTVASPIIRPDEAHKIIAAGVLLDLAAPSVEHKWIRHAMGHYGQRILALNHVFSAAHQTMTYEISIERFITAIRRANVFGGMHGHSVSDPTSDPNVAEAQKAMSTTDPSSVGITREHLNDPLASTLESEFVQIDEAISRHPDDPPPVVLHRLADCIVKTDDNLELGRSLRQLADTWPSPLTRLRPIVPIAPIAPQTIVEQNQCIEGQPHLGGQWELERISAKEVDDKCSSAEALDRASSKFYGEAGAHWIKAQNEWIETKECFKDADTRKCKREEDHGYNKCTEERDEGYNRCDRQEDHGHNECCDWWPCSWACDALVWIVNIVCVAWTWIKKIVCVAWEYVLGSGLIL